MIGILILLFESNTIAGQYQAQTPLMLGRLRF